MFRKSPEQQQFEDKIEEIFLFVQGRQIDNGSQDEDSLNSMFEEAIRLGKVKTVDINVSVKTEKMLHRETLLTLAATYLPSQIIPLLAAGLNPKKTPTTWMSSPLKRLMDYQPQAICYGAHLIQKGDSPYVVNKEGKNIIDLIVECNFMLAIGEFNRLEKKQIDIGYLMKGNGIKTHQLVARGLEATIKDANWFACYPLFKWVGNFWKEDLFKAICQMDVEEGTRLLEACIDPKNGLGRVMYWQRTPGLFGGKQCSLKSGVLKKVVDELVKRKPEMLDKIESKAEEMENFVFNDEVDESKAEGFHNSL